MELSSRSNFEFLRDTGASIHDLQILHKRAIDNDQITLAEEIKDTLEIARGKAGVTIAKLSKHLKSNQEYECCACKSFILINLAMPKITMPRRMLRRC